MNGNDVLDEEVKDLSDARQTVERNLLFIFIAVGGIFAGLTAAFQAGTI